jgi:sugar lactone lactonase YvrE
MLTLNLRNHFIDRNYENIIAMKAYKMVYRLILLFIFLLLALSPRAQAEFLITTVAGNGERGYSSSHENSTATLVKLAYPYDVAIGNNNDLYIADTYNHRIRKVNAQGLITTIAGNGEEGYSGDGSLATAAKLNNPEGIALDNQGNLYIADRDNHCIRKVDTQGIITTIAGDSHEGYSGDGGLAVVAQLNDPVSIMVDNTSNLYIADMDNHRIRKVDTQGIITTIAGNGEEGYSGDGDAATQAQLNLPHDMALDAKGVLYIADTHNHCIRQVDTTGIITTFAGNHEEGFSGDYNTAITARFNDPESLVLDKQGHLYVTDMDNHRVRQITPQGIITTIAGNGEEGYSGDGEMATMAKLNNPEGLALDVQGHLYIADTHNHSIRKLIPIKPQIRIEKTTLIF